MIGINSCIALCIVSEVITIKCCCIRVTLLWVFWWHIVCFKCSQRVLYAYRKEDHDGDGEPDPQPIPGSFSGRVPQIVELVTVSSNGEFFSYTEYALRTLIGQNYLVGIHRQNIIYLHRIGNAQKQFTVVYMRTFIRGHWGSTHTTWSPKISGKPQSTRLLPTVWLRSPTRSSCERVT